MGCGVVWPLSILSGHVRRVLSKDYNHRSLRDGGCASAPFFRVWSQPSMKSLYSCAMHMLVSKRNLLRPPWPVASPLGCVASVRACQRLCLACGKRLTIAPFSSSGFAQVYLSLPKFARGPWFSLFRYVGKVGGTSAGHR